MRGLQRTRMDVYIFLFLGLFSRFTGTVGQKSYVAESSNVFTTAFLKYNKHFRPYNESATPLLLNVRFDLVKVLKVDPETPSMTSIVDTRFQWVDGRLYWYSDIIKHVTVNVTEVWTPDVYFLNMESQPEVLINPRFLTIESTGKVYWYQRTKLITPCSSESNGDFICPVTFGSMQFPQSELDFDRIECEYSNANSKNVNVTSVAMEIDTEDLPRVPFSKSTSKRGSCVASISVDLEASNREKYSYQKFEAQRGNMKSSSVYIMANLVTVILSLTCVWVK